MSEHPARPSAQLLLEQMWRNVQQRTDGQISSTVENTLGGVVKGGFLNAGMLFGGIPSRETVHNATGGALTKGEAVYATGDSSGFTTVAKAKADADATMPALGVLAEDIANGADGVLMKVGRVETLDTSAWAVGTVLYVSAATAGALTSTAPAARVQAVALVLVQDATDGVLEVMAALTMDSPDIPGVAGTRPLATADGVSEWIAGWLVPMYDGDLADAATALAMTDTGGNLIVDVV